mgnify:CR=1 FL=1
MNKKQNDPSVEFLYGTFLGRAVLKVILKSRIDRVFVKFLWSKHSKFIIKRYAEKHNIALSKDEIAKFSSFREFFARVKENLPVDEDLNHLISPCDGWLSCFKIDENSSFSIKSSHYRLSDFLEDEETAREFVGGDCLIFRLCASDYHHYCYIDYGYQGKQHNIRGVLHSVQPIAAEKMPVYVLNRRSWTLLITENFGPVIQTEIGALVVGGIVNYKENERFSKGEEKGHFELAGSTIVLLFKKNRIKLNEEIRKVLSENDEVRVSYGGYIGEAV